MLDTNTLKLEVFAQHESLDCAKASFTGKLTRDPAPR